MELIANFQCYNYTHQCYKLLTGIRDFYWQATGVKMKSVTWFPSTLVFVFDQISIMWKTAGQERGWESFQAQDRAAHCRASRCLTVLSELLTCYTAEKCKEGLRKRLVSCSLFFFFLLPNDQIALYSLTNFLGFTSLKLNYLLIFVFVCGCVWLCMCQLMYMEVRRQLAGIGSLSFHLIATRD